LDSVEKLAGAVTGALLADDVGLGKTIETGLVLARRWAKRKRSLLIIVRANLRNEGQAPAGFPRRLVSFMVCAHG